MTEIADQRFNKLIALHPTKRRTPDRNIIWECQCDCGQVCFVPARDLVRGNTQSCGCLKKENTQIGNLVRGKFGSAHPKYSTGVRDGYRIIGTDVGQQREHRLIVETVLGRKLKQNEVVHHINGNKLDNRKCNLLVCSRTYHTRLHQRMGFLYMQEKFRS